MEILLLTALLVLSTDGDQTRTVHPGQDVTLTGPDCSANASVRLKRRGSDQYIYYCRDGHVIRPEDQDPSFVGRVEETECPLKSGIVSVAVMNVTREDSGEYEWFCKNNTGNSSSTVYLNVTDPGAADGGNTSGNTTSGNTTSGNTTSGIPPDVGAIIGGTFAVVLIVVIIIIHLCGSRFRCRIPCRLSGQQNSELPVTYREVKQQQV